MFSSSSTQPGPVPGNLIATSIAVRGTWVVIKFCELPGYYPWREAYLTPAEADELSAFLTAAGTVAIKVGYDAAVAALDAGEVFVERPTGGQ